jgi:hypothetical protein
VRALGSRAQNQGLATAGFQDLCLQGFGTHTHRRTRGSSGANLSAIAPPARDDSTPPPEMTNAFATEKVSWNDGKASRKKGAFQTPIPEGGREGGRE